MIRIVTEDRYRYHFARHWEDVLYPVLGAAL
jgi:hypothetical protein